MRPDVVWISLDTLRADRLGCYGYERQTSPALDRFAEGALLYERAIAPANETIASHAAMFQATHASRALSHEGPVVAQAMAFSGYRTAAFTDGGPMSKRFGFDRGFETFEDQNSGLDDSLPRAQQWLNAGGSPAFLFLHTFDIHLPYDPPEPWASVFGPDPTPGGLTGAQTLGLLRGERAIFESAGKPSAPLTAVQRERVSDLYDAGIRWTDERLGEWLSALTTRERPTVVIVTSDHGEEFWDHGSVLHAHTLYQELVGVPLVIFVPGVEPRRVSQPVTTTDIAPTIFAAAGLPSLKAFSGRSLLPEQGDGAALGRSTIVSEGLAFGTQIQSVVEGDVKLIVSTHLETPKVELFALDQDPTEQINLAERQPDTVARLQGVLGEILGTAAAVEHPFDAAESADAETRARLQALGYLDGPH